MKILVIKLGALGDMVLASAAFTAIKRQFPKSDFSLLTTPAYFPIIKDCPYFRQYFLFDREKPFRPQAQKITAELRREKFQLVINLQNNFKSNLLARLSGAPERIGFRKGLRLGLLTKNVVYDQQETALWNLNRVLALADIPAAKQPELYLTSKTETEAENLLKSLGWKNEPLFGLHPGSSAGWQSKRWPVQHWVILARAISKNGAIPVFFGDSSEFTELEEIAGNIQGKSFNLAGKTSLTILPAVIKRCRTFISTDSGPLFIAAAAGIKTVGLYGPTESKRHAPPGVIIMEKKNLPCRPCYRKSCGQPLCLSNITPEDILSVLR
ncbi:MAG: lipopolysaccharide heptosyltransferase II [Candidatus Ratteibacteria bacterium]|jgi:lipopolysaccharide heptosyltransferase II